MNYVGYGKEVALRVKTYADFSHIIIIAPIKKHYLFKGNAV